MPTATLTTTPTAARPTLDRFIRALTAHEDHWSTALFIVGIWPQGDNLYLVPRTYLTDQTPLGTLVIQTDPHAHIDQDEITQATFAIVNTCLPNTNWRADPTPLLLTIDARDESPRPELPSNQVLITTGISLEAMPDLNPHDLDNRHFILNQL